MRMCQDCGVSLQPGEDEICGPCVTLRKQFGMGTPTAERRKPTVDRAGLPRTRSGRGEGPGQGPDPVSRARAAEACGDGPFGSHCPCWDSGATCCWCGGDAKLL